MKHNPHTTLPIRLLRLVRLAWHSLSGLIVVALILPRLPTQARERRIRDWCAALLKILGVQVSIKGDIPHDETRKTLFVANHISWIDIWALKAALPMQFVAKAEIRTWPLVGYLSQKTGTLFIERESRHATRRVMRSVEQALHEGQCLCLFPEGTTTDGTELRPFKPGLIQAAINAEAQVWPLAIRYPGTGGRPNTAIAYHGDVTLLQSLKEVLKQSEILIELDFAAPIATAGHDRRQLSLLARQAIAARLNLPQH